MRKRNIQIVIDLSMSMKPAIGLVYAYLYQFLSHLCERNEIEIEVSFQLTWFMGDTSEQVIFHDDSEDRNYTTDFDELMGNIKLLKLRQGARTNAETIQQALQISMQQSHGEPQEQILFFFSDYLPNNVIDMNGFGKLNRVFLFVPKEKGMYYRFQMVNSGNAVHKLMPVLVWDLESLSEKLTEEDMECIQNYLA